LRIVGRVRQLVLQDLDAPAVFDGLGNRLAVALHRFQLLRHGVGDVGLHDQVQQTHFRVKMMQAGMPVP
jgi:hypothetical protein